MSDRRVETLCYKIRGCLNNFPLFPESINQSINQSVNQFITNLSIIQSIDQSINQPIYEYHNVGLLQTMLLLFFCNMRRKQHELN